MATKAERERQRKQNLTLLYSSLPSAAANAVKSFADKSLDVTGEFGLVDDTLLYDWLRNGPTIKVRCLRPVMTESGTVQNPRHDEQAWPQHLLRLLPDGGFEFPNHPEVQADAEGVLMLGALGGYAPTCLLIAHAFRTGDWPAWGEVWNNNAKLMTFYALMQWALEGRTAQDVEPLLPTGTTPSQWQAWEQDGWTMKQAKPFLTAGATPEQSRSWLAAGRTDSLAGSLAAEGKGPEDALAWDASGLSKTEIAAWRRFTGRGPEFVLRLRGLGFQPRDLSFIAAGDEEMLQTRIRWAEGGIPPTDFYGYYQETRGDLALAQDLCAAAVPAWMLETLRDLERNQGRVPLTHAQLCAWAPLGCSQPGEFLAAADSGLTPEEFADTVRMMPSRDRGAYGSDFLNVLRQVVPYHAALLRRGMALSQRTSRAAGGESA